MGLLESFWSFLWLHLMDLGKIVLSIFMIGLSLFTLYILLNLKKWHAQLEDSERMAFLARDEAMVGLAHTRMQLVEVRQRIDALGLRTLNLSSSHKEELMKYARSALSMAVSQERSIFQWGMLGLKIAKSTYGYFRGR